MGIHISIISRIGDSPTRMIYDVEWASLDIDRNSLLFIFPLSMLLMRELVTILYETAIIDGLGVIDSIFIHVYLNDIMMITNNIYDYPNLSSPYF